MRGGAGHANERARKWDSDPRGGSELGFVHRGKGYKGESGGLGMQMRGPGAGIRIRDGVRVGVCSQREGVRR